MLARLRHCIFLLVLLTLSLEVFADPSNPVCTTIKSCEQLQEKLNEAMEQLTSAPPITFLDVEKDASGNALLLTQVEAMAFCTKLNGHLPTALEMTQFATLQGAPPSLTLKEIFEKYDGEVPEGYKNIKSVSPSGVKESFFYSQQGYNTPGDALKAGWLWTSSTLNTADKDGFLFYGVTGSFVYGKNIQNAKSSFVCVK
jgi:hypothetical protein